jgi:hypothetical protein
MTRKDFEAIAQIVADLREASANHGKGYADFMSYRLAAYLAKCNPRFDRRRFLTACGTQYL